MDGRQKIAVLEKPEQEPVPMIYRQVYEVMVIHLQTCRISQFLGLITDLRRILSGLSIFLVPGLDAVSVNKKRSLKK